MVEHRRRIRKPSNITGERDLDDRVRERLRKELKSKHPKDSLRFIGKRWKIYRDKKEQVEHQVSPLVEISLRTGVITGYLMKVKQYGNSVDKGISKLKSLSSDLRGVSDDKERDRINSEIVKTDGEVFFSLRKMIMYGSLLSGISGLGNDRGYKLLKKMEKKRRR